MDNLNFIQFTPQEKLEYATLILMVHVGANNDGDKCGISHYVEHMLVAQLKQFFLKNDINFIATTYCDYTSYEISCKDNISDILEYIYVLINIYKGKYLTETTLEDVRGDIFREFSHTIYTEQYKRVVELSKYDNDIGNMAIGTIEVIKSLQYPEIIKFHKENYTNATVSVGIVSGLDIKEKFKVNQLEEEQVNLLSKKYGKISSSILFEQNHRCTIYQKERYFNKSYRARFIEDLSTAIIETCIYTEYGIDVLFYKAYYGRESKYWITNAACNTEQFLKIIQDETNPINRISCKEVKKYRKEYMKQTKDINITMQVYASELLYHLAYGIPVYQPDIWQKVNTVISDDEILKEISDRLTNYAANIIKVQ